MTVQTQTFQLIHPGPNAAYTVEHVDIPIDVLDGAPDNHATGSRWKLDSGEYAIKQPRPEHHTGLPGTLFLPKAPTRKWVMIIPGAGDNRFAFKWIFIKQLLAHGISVLTIDPPGHGEFIHVPATVRNTRLAAQVAADWLLARPDAGSVGVMGISFGGNQALWLTAQEPCIAAVATLSTPILLPPVTRAVVAREALGLVQPRNAMLLRYASWPQIWAEWKSMRGAWLGENLHDMIVAHDTLNTVRAIGARPTAFVHGSSDVAVPVENARRLYDAALPARALILVPQATHISVIMHAREMQRLADWFFEHL